MKNKINLKRRTFLQNAALLTGGSAALSSYGKLQLIQSAAAAPGDYADLTDYKSLVCVFLPGGNDALNTFIPTTDTEYQSYASIRRHLAIDRTDLNLIADGSHGFHPSLAGVRDLYNSNQLAVAANIGNLFQPISREQYFNFTDNNTDLNVPPDLFAHDKQQEIWHSGLSPVVGIHHPGWGGRMIDLLATANTNPDAPPAFTLAGNNPWQVGENEFNRTYSYSTEDGVPISINTFQRFNGVTTSDDPLRATRSAAWDAILNLQRTDPLQAHAARAFLDTRRRANLLRNELQQNSFSIQTPLPGGSLASQLRAVAEMISLREALGLKRQTFFVTPSGSWDAHGSQLFDHARLLTQLSDGLSSFQNTLNELGVEDSVTTFTASEFGRSLSANGDGTDHAWATDYMVMGGAVDGGQIFGDQVQYSDVPEGEHFGEQLFGPQDVGSGRFIPEYSTDQYGATLAKWMGVNDDDLHTIFPNLENFVVKDLGFMKS